MNRRGFIRRRRGRNPTGALRLALVAATLGGLALPPAPSTALGSRTALVALVPPIPPAAARTALPPGTPLPDGRGQAVISVMGGSRNHYWTRLAYYSFTAGRGAYGSVHESYWYWSMDGFRGNAATNKVATGYTTRGCAAWCTVRTPVGFQPTSGPSGALDGRYHLDAAGGLVIEWRTGEGEAWTLANQGSFTRMALQHGDGGTFAGDGFLSRASFATHTTRTTVSRTPLAGTQRQGSYGDGRGVVSAYWAGNTVTPGLRTCHDPGCLFAATPGWRQALIVPPTLGRRAYWQHQVTGADGEGSGCFSAGGGHTVALLQGIDDRGEFIGFVGSEASFNARFRGNAVVAQIALSR